MLAAKVSAYDSMPTKDLRSLFGQVVWIALQTRSQTLRSGQRWPLIKSIIIQTHSVSIKFQLVYQRIGDTPTL
jgi:hypothetical protein